MSTVDRILEGIDKQLALPDPLEGLTGPEVARVALDGLKASVELGYIQPENARAIYGIHFPGFEYDPVVE